MAGAYYNSVENAAHVGYRWEYEDFGRKLVTVTGYPEADVVSLHVAHKDFLIASCNGAWHCSTPDMR